MKNDDWVQRRFDAFWAVADPNEEESATTKHFARRAFYAGLVIGTVMKNDAPTPRKRP